MGRKYQNNYSTTITTASVGTGDLTFDVTTAPSALAAGEYYHLTITDSLTSPTKTEIVKCTAIATNTLTVVRAQEGTTAQTWVTGDYVELRATDASFETLDNPTLYDYTEQSSTAAGTVIQTAGQLIWERTLTANTTFTDGMVNGQSLTMHVYDGDTWTATWPTVTWVGGSAPTLTAADVIVWWKVSGTLYASYHGSIV